MTITRQIVFCCAFLGLIPHFLVAGRTNNRGHKPSRGTFANPSAQVRPRFRYWLPDSSVDHAILAADIKSAGDIGAGGVEFLPYFNYGGSVGAYPPGADWARYGFGTPAFHQIFQTVLQAHDSNGLVMDFAFGPNQGQGVPALTTDPGLQWDLNFGVAKIPVKGSYSGPIPGWGQGDLVALVVSSVISQDNITFPQSATLSTSLPQQPYQLILVLAESSLQLLTEHVSSSGMLDLSLASCNATIERQLFAFYQKQTLEKNLRFPNNRTGDIFDDGSYTVDHYCGQGAETIINFWEKYILPGGVLEMLRRVGNYGWEDSPELLCNISWTPGLPARFEEKFGYSIYTYLPLLMAGNNNINLQSANPGLYSARFDNDTLSSQVLNDYRSVLADGYQEYYSVLRRWLHSRLNLQLSFQPSYNLPMDALANIPSADAPECESLQFNNSIDAYRQFSGPAYLTGKHIVSNEMGAVQFKAYQLAIPQLLSYIHRAFSGGVNQIILHGQTYGGNYLGATWPGYTPFEFAFSEIYSERQPAWRHGFDEALEYIARTQYVLQQGVPKIDVAFVNKRSATDPLWATLYNRSDLSEAGYTYAYLSPDNLHADFANITNGRLTLSGPSFKVIAITNDMNITATGVAMLDEYAEDGLPIVFVGGPPRYYPDSYGTQSQFDSALRRLSTRKNVFTSSQGQLAAKLLSIGVTPQIAVRTNATWYPTWRQDVDNGVDYAFVFADSAASSGTIAVSSSKIPYLYNAWTGERQPILNYERKGTKVQISLTLKANQAVIIAFSNDFPDIDIPGAHFTSLPRNVVGSSSKGKNTLSLKLTSSPNISQAFGLSNGRNETMKNSSSVCPAFPLLEWTLIAEHWEAPTSLLDSSTVAKHNTTHQLPSLTSWTDIPGLVNASGIGYYQTSLEWSPESCSADGAYLSISSVLHAAQVFVNGQKCPPVDCFDGKVDIGPYLIQGTNTVSITVPTRLWNYIRSIFPKIKLEGATPLLLLLVGGASNLPPPTQEGLIGTVSVIPYQTQDISV